VEPGRISGALVADRPPPPVPSGEAQPDEGAILPFAPEIGGAALLPSGAFAVGALEPKKSELRALALLLAPGAMQRRVDLGSVHGDVLPPRIAARGGVVVSAVPTGAPKGTLLRLCRIESIEGTPVIRWGKEIPSGADESDSFSLEVGEGHSVLAWDEWDAEGGHSKVVAATLVDSDPANVTAALTLSAAGEDAEAPLVVARPGGFFAAWITNGKRAPDAEQRKETTEKEALGEDTPAVDLGPRWLMLRRLDARGSPAGLPLAVTPRDGQVMGFDMVATKDGAALVAYRDDRAAPGTAGGLLWSVVVHAGGSIHPQRLEADDLGAAAPQLFVDAAATGSAPVTWLSVAGESDSTWLTTLDAEGREEDPLAAEPALDGASLLGVRDSSVLVARPRGRGLELSSARCRPGRLPPSPSPSPSPAPSASAL